ncbi:MAG: hypothetical protein ACTSQI_17850 [Candidatus Helarchaeota archaeon]
MTEILIEPPREYVKPVAIYIKSGDTRYPRSGNLVAAAVSGAVGAVVSVAVASAVKGY